MYLLKKGWIVLLTAMLLLASVAGCSFTSTITEIQTVTKDPGDITTDPDPDPAILTVFAASSLRNAMDELKDVYLASRPWIKQFNTNYNGSGALQTGIESAFPGQVDIFISAAAAQMNNLQDKGFLVNASRKNLLNNQIVLVVPKSSAWNISSFNDLATASGKTLALGAIAVPAGDYARAAFDLLGITSAVNNAMEIVEFGEVAAVLAAVASGNADAGIVYSTDALSNDGVKVVAVGPDAINAQIVYPISIIKGSNYPDAAQDFIDFLFSEEAAAIFVKYGFVLAAQ